MVERIVERTLLFKLKSGWHAIEGLQGWEGDEVEEEEGGLK